MSTAKERVKELTGMATGLREEVARLRHLLYQYGDHSLECYSASTTRCTCGWYRERRDLGIRPRPGQD